jgi:hypothetical protein
MMLFLKRIIIPYKPKLFYASIICITKGFQMFNVNFKGHTSKENESSNVLYPTVFSYLFQYRRKEGSKVLEVSRGGGGGMGDGGWGTGWGRGTTNKGSEGSTSTF